MDKPVGNMSKDDKVDGKNKAVVPRACGGGASGITEVPLNRQHLSREWR